MSSFWNLRSLLMEKGGLFGGRNKSGAFFCSRSLKKANCTPRKPRGGGGRFDNCFCSSRMFRGASFDPRRSQNTELGQAHIWARWTLGPLATKSDLSPPSREKQQGTLRFVRDKTDLDRERCVYVERNWNVSVCWPQLFLFSNFRDVKGTFLYSSLPKVSGEKS